MTPFFAESIAQPRHPPHSHANREILPFDVRRANAGFVGSAEDWDWNCIHNVTGLYRCWPSRGDVYTLIKYFCNDYPTFTDMNNLSLVTFIEYAGCGIVVPGDLERAGWEELLKKPAFCQCLRETNIFIASHHGRNAGYCEQVFDYCDPAIVLLSDKGIVHSSQDHDFTKHARGIQWNNDPTQKRRVLTTRSDGHIRITKEFGKGLFVTSNVTL